MARRSPPRKVTYFEPVAPRLGRNTIIESTFEVGHRFRCTMRIDCCQLDPGAVIRPDPGEWHPRMSSAAAVIAVPPPARWRKTMRKRFRTEVEGGTLSASAVRSDSTDHGDPLWLRGRPQPTDDSRGRRRKSPRCSQQEMLPPPEG
jgi:hypothetical protein